MKQPLDRYLHGLENGAAFRWSSTRRYFLSRMSGGLGAAALASLLGPQGHAEGSLALGATAAPARGRSPPRPSPRPAAAKRVIYLFQSGGPAQMDLYDYKPALRDRFGEEVPKSVYPDDRKTTMTSAQNAFPVAPSRFRFRRHGQGGVWLSDVLPHLGHVADELCVIRSVHTEAINHDPAITFLLTGSQIAGRPSMGAWLTYGLGSESSELPAFVAMSSRGRGRAGQPLYDRLWGSGFLPTRFQGVKFRNQGDPVLDLHDPPGVSRQTRRVMLDRLAALNEQNYRRIGDPDIRARIGQYELAYRMQMSVPELLDFSREPASVVESYGPDARKTGTFAYNCLMARRLAERGVRFIQLFHQGWDQHNQLPKQIAAQCRDTDRPAAALIADLKQRGMLDETLIVWGGEFGRTVYSQGKLTRENYGRDHHPGCFSVWLAGAGVRGGMTYGRTDDYSVNVVEDGVHIHDLQATVLHCLGIDHERLTYRFQGRDFRLTDVSGRVVREILS